MQIVTKRMALLIQNKMDFKTKKVTRDKEEHYILRKGTKEQEDVAIINIPVPNNRPPKQMKQKLTELSVIVGSFNTLLSIMDRTARQKIRKQRT